MSLDLQSDGNQRKIDAFIRPAVVFNTRKDLEGQIVLDCIDKYGNALLGCYFLGPPGASFNYSIPTGEQVIVIKSGLDGNNFIIGQTNNQIAGEQVKAPTEVRPDPTTSVQNYTTTHAGDYEVKVDTDARLNLNSNIGATIDGRNVNIQLHDGILRIAQDQQSGEGRSEELLLNANQTIDVLLGNYEALLNEMARMREAIRQTNAYAEALQNALASVAFSAGVNPVTGVALAGVVSPVGAVNPIDATDAGALNQSIADFNSSLDDARNKNITVPLGSPEVSIDEATSAGQLGES